MKRKHLQLLYIIIATADILSLLFYEPLRVITKPLLMVSLIGYYFLFAVHFKILFLLALFFALLGDIFLLGNGLNYFLMGLGSFLIMQVLYACVFYENRSQISAQDLIGGVILALIGIILIYILWPNLSSTFKIPVSIYSLAILVMAFFAVRRKKSNATYLPVLVGALFFVSSDALLAINEFTEILNHAGLWVMITYILAQFFIVTGITEE
jgi:uncharacterized membrane protein YhhN